MYKGKCLTLSSSSLSHETINMWPSGKKCQNILSYKVSTYSLHLKLKVKHIRYVMNVRNYPSSEKGVIKCMALIVSHCSKCLVCRINLGGLILEMDSSFEAFQKMKLLRFLIWWGGSIEQIWLLNKRLSYKSARPARSCLSAFAKTLEANPSKWRLSSGASFSDFLSCQRTRTQNDGHQQQERYIEYKNSRDKTNPHTKNKRM